LEPATGEIREMVKEVAHRRRQMPGAVSGAMQELQEHFGYLSEEALIMLAEELDVPLSRLFGMATFFSFFNLKPRGERHLQVCMGTACHVLGAEQIGRKIERDLDISDGDATPDRSFSFEKVRCLGCCSLAPVVRMNDDIHGRVRMKTVDQLLKKKLPKEKRLED